MSVIPKIIPRSEHSISRTKIDKGVLDVLYSLSRSGYEAYLVGGGLRDLLLGLEPKDFDVVTNATPEQVKQVFRSRCRIIGRRFRLAHVHVGDKVIEVATFRAQAQERGDRLIDDQGMLRRDNVYGTRDEDVWRRDFTINALYYNIEDYSLIDYVGAIEDLQSGQLKLIGQAEVRYREDPVRMIRAVRFSCKLGFILPPETARALPELSHLLAESAPARLYEEVLKLFHGGQGACVFDRLIQHGLFETLFDQTDYCLKQPDSWSHVVIPQALKQIDEKVVEGVSVSPSFLFAVLLWEPVWQALDKFETEAVHVDELLKSATSVLNEQNERTSLARPLMQQIKEIWALQLLLTQHQEKAQRIMGLPRFKAALDFMQLRVLALPSLKPVVESWQTLIQSNPDWLFGSEAMLSEHPVETASTMHDDSVDKQGQRRKRRRRPRNKSAT